MSWSGEHLVCASFASHLFIFGIAKHSPWPGQIAATSKIRDVRISPNGRRILYQVQAAYVIDHALSELWIAQIDVQNSTRPLTNGLFNDKAGVFHPDDKHVVFLSDRDDQGKSAHIYILDPDGGEYPEPMRVADFGKNGVQNFEISPNGQYIAFTSMDETVSEEALRKINQKDDARVFGESNRSVRLRVYSFRMNTISTIEGIRKDRYIEAFTWSPDSKQLLYRLRRGQGPEYAEQEVTLERISVGEGSLVPVVLESYQHSPAGQNIWLPSGYITSLQSYDPSNLLDARTLFAYQINELSTSGKVGDHPPILRSPFTSVVAAGRLRTAKHPSRVSEVRR
jgi:dipeptidyl aminopeptidase/acylaminoacyl peptidase